MNCYLSVETLLIASDKCPDLYLSIGRSIYWEEKGFSDSRGKHRCGLVTKETWLCIRKHTMLFHAVTCHLSVETLLISSDKCPDLYLSIGRQEPINYGLLRKINIFAVNP